MSATPTRRQVADAVADRVRVVAAEVLADVYPGAPVDAWCGLLDRLAQTYGWYIDARFSTGDASRFNETRRRAEINAYISALYALARPWKVTTFGGSCLRSVLYQCACEAHSEALRQTEVNSLCFWCRTTPGQCSVHDAQRSAS